MSVNSNDSYYAVASNSCGNVASSVVSLNYIQPPAAPIVSVSQSAIFCEGESATLTVQNPCSGCTFNWIPTNESSASIQVYTSNSYYVIMSNNCGSVSSSPQSITAYSIPPIPVITVNGNELQSSSASGNQWYLNGNPISGATEQTYTASQSGSYFVTVTSNICMSQSNPVSVVRTGINQLKQGSQIAVFPNPTTGVVSIQFSKEEKNMLIEVFDVAGKRVFQSTASSVSANEVKTLNLSDLANAVYELRIKTDENFSTTQLVIRK
jgi:hypothetical protein